MPFHSQSPHGRIKDLPGYSYDDVDYGTMLDVARGRRFKAWHNIMPMQLERPWTDADGNPVDPDKMKVEKKAMEFPTQDAMKTYLKDHPKADKSKHTVKETKKQTQEIPQSKSSESLEILYEGEAEFNPDDAEWQKQHTMKTNGGSLVMGTPHTGSGEGEDYINKVVEGVVSHAKEAIKAGKKVVFLAEDTLGDDGMPWESTEQRQVADALKKVGGKNVTIDSWDKGVEVLDKSGEQIDTKSAGYSKLVSNSTPDDVEAGLFAFMAGQGAELNSVSDSAKKVLKGVGIDLPDDLSKMGDDVRDKMYGLTFPDDGGGKLDDNGKKLWHVSLAYNKMREDNLVKKMGEYEKAGNVCIATPGSSHAFALSKNYSDKPKSVDHIVDKIMESLPAGATDKQIGQAVEQAIKEKNACMQQPLRRRRDYGEIEAEIEKRMKEASMKAKVYKSPEKVHNPDNLQSVFLAGAIGIASKISNDFLSGCIDMGEV